MRKLSYFLVIFYTIQGLLGGLTVFKSNIPWSVAIHLASAFLLFYIVLNILLLTYDPKKKNCLLIKLKPTYVYITIFFLVTACAGAFTSKYGASFLAPNGLSVIQVYFLIFTISSKLYTLLIDYLLYL